MRLPVGFQVKRSKPELVAPAKPTPYEFKNLSDLDNMKAIQLHVGFINFYKRNEKMEGRDPAKVIREAIARALVYYYPIAGRLRREGATTDDKGLLDNLVVECTGEGAMFVEAEANMRLDQLDSAPQPPFPKDLLYNGPRSGSVVDSPLLLTQVTRLTCGGFTFAIELSHTMIDGVGLKLFANTVGEMACGVCVPSVQPVWNRELLKARDPLPEKTTYHELQNTNSMPPYEVGAQLTWRSFFFGSKQILALRNQLPPHLQGVSRFDLLAAFLWKCRTSALGFELSDKVFLFLAVDARRKFNPPLPVGYYGNAFASPAAMSTTKELCEAPLGYAVELVKYAKDNASEELVRAYINLLATVEEAPPPPPSWFSVSDVTRIGYHNVDVGWGKAVYTGLLGLDQEPTCYITSTKNNKGEDVVAARVSLPEPFWERFVAQIDKMICEPSHANSSVILSNL